MEGRFADYYTAWREACNAAGIERIPHDFPRTAVRNFERAGVPRTPAMAMVGHKTESIFRGRLAVNGPLLFGFCSALPQPLPPSTELYALLRARPPQDVFGRRFNGIRETLPIGLILFVPLVALVLKALYFRSHELYVDHLVFAAHFQSALFLLLAACWLILRLVNAGFLVAILTYVPVAFLMLTIYLPWALRLIYEESRWMTAAKTVMLLFAYAILLREAGESR